MLNHSNQQPSQSPPNKIVTFLLNHPIIRTFTFQLITCIFLVFMVFSTAVYPPFENHPQDPNPFHIIYVAVIVYSIICFSGPICGAHINPAVSTATFLAKKKQKGDLKLYVGYVAAQIIGCFIGVLLSRWIYGFGGPIYDEGPDFFALSKDCIEEFIGTFLLIFSIFIVTHAQTTFIYDQAWIHLIIGILYYFCLSFSTHLHILHPGIVLTVQLQGMIHDGLDSSGLGAAFCLIVSQLLGAFFSQLIFMKLYLPKMKAWKNHLTE